MMISYAQNFEDVMLWRALGHVDKGFYIDIGAQHPVIDSVSRAFYEKGWRGIHVEADPAYAALLKEDRPDEKVIQAAVTNARGAMTFYEIPDTGLSTGDRSIAKKHKERGFEIREIKVPCMTLEDLFRQAGQRDIHWLKIDVEGMEQQVLRGWGRSKARPWIVVVESTLPMTQTETHAQWEPLLLKKDYKPVYFDGLNRYYRSSRRPRLAAAFRTGPNIFDDFQLNGTASSSFCALVNERHQRQERDLSSQLHAEQQMRQATELESAQHVKVLNEEVNRRREEFDDLQRTLALKEQDLNRQLQAEQHKHQAIVLEIEKRDRTLNEQLNRNRRELDDLRQTLELREKDLSQQLQAELQKRQAIELDHAQREKTLNDQISRNRNELDQLRRALDLSEKDLVRQVHAEQQKHQTIDQEWRQQEQKLNDQIRIVQSELDDRMRSMQKREQEVIAQILAIQQQAARDIADQTRIYREEVRTLQEKHAEREQSFVSQLLAGRQELRSLMQDQAEREKSLSSLVAQASQKHHQDMENLLRSFAVREKEFGEQMLAVQKSRDEERSGLLRRHAEQEMQLRQEFAARENSIREEVGLKLAAARAEAQQEITEQNRIHEERAKALNASLIKQQGVFETLQFQLTELKMHQANSAVSNIIDQNVGGPKTDINSIEHVDQLLSLHDAVFIEAVYHTLLGRAPDREGMDYYQKRLRAGYGKVAVLVQIAAGPEAREKGTDLRGLRELMGAHRKANGWFQKRRSRNGHVEQYIQRLENELGHVLKQVQMAQGESAERIVGMEQTMMALDQASTNAASASEQSAEPLPKQSDPDLSGLTPYARRLFMQMKHAMDSATGRRSI